MELTIELFHLEIVADITVIELK